jgi:hypothetical protein
MSDERYYVMPWCTMYCLSVWLYEGDQRIGWLFWYRQVKLKPCASAGPLLEWTLSTLIYVLGGVISLSLVDLNENRNQYLAKSSRTSVRCIYTLIKIVGIWKRWHERYLDIIWLLFINIFCINYTNKNFFEIIAGLRKGTKNMYKKLSLEGDEIHLVSRRSSKKFFRFFSYDCKHCLIQTPRTTVRANPTLWLQPQHNWIFLKRRLSVIQF